MAGYEEPLLKEGYLVKAPDAVKHHHNFRKWQRKLFRLDVRGDLYYYDSEKSTRPTGIIPLVQCSRVSNAKGKFGDQLSYCIGLELNDAKYYLKAESARSYNEWIGPLSKFVKDCELTMIPDGTLDRRDTVSSEAWEGPGVRTDSVVSRHFSVATKAKFLSKEGWLAKTGGNNKGWKDRYFVLTNGKLTYYKNDKKDSAQGSIDLFECTGVEKTAGKKGFGFDIKIPGRVFNISSDSEASQNDWMSSISHSLGLIKDIKSSTSGVPRSDSIDSQHSRELALLESLAPAADLTTEAHSDQDISAEGSSSSLPPPSLLAKKEDKKDSDVVQLLEAEVDALRHKVASLEGDLTSSTTANSQLQQQLSKVKSSLDSSTRQLTEERNNLHLQVEQLQKSKSELETVNDSLRAQLEEHIVRLQEMEEEQIGLRQDLEEAQTASTAVEEDLVDTQQKLHEIEEVARSLEDALKKKSESEPQTPIISSAKALGLAYQAKLESFQADQLNPDSDNKLESQKVEQLKEQLKQTEAEKDELKAEVQRLRTTEMPANLSTASSPEEPGTASLSEERLRWQMEKENLRKELKAKMDAEREPMLKEKEALENKLRILEETSPSLTKDEVNALQQNLTESRSRVQQLESEVESQAEKISQLLVEKEKAVADLIAIRKINRNIEKKISETEVGAQVSQPIESPTPNGVQETEKTIEELKSTLIEVERERDELRTKLNQKHSSGVAPDVDLTDTSQFRFRSKTLATVATNNQLSSVARIDTNQIPNGNTTPRQEDNPPPKPKRPPKELLNRYSYQQEPQQNNSRPVSNILQSLFSRR